MVILSPKYCSSSPLCVLRHDEREHNTAGHTLDGLLWPGVPVWFAFMASPIQGPRTIRYGILTDFFDNRSSRNLAHRPKLREDMMLWQEHRWSSLLSKHPKADELNTVQHVAAAGN